MRPVIAKPLLRATEWVLSFYLNGWESWLFADTFSVRFIFLLRSNCSSLFCSIRSICVACCYQSTWTGRLLFQQTTPCAWGALENHGPKQRLQRNSCAFTIKKVITLQCMHIWNWMESQRRHRIERWAQCRFAAAPCRMRPLNIVHSKCMDCNIKLHLQETKTRIMMPAISNYYKYRTFSGRLSDA